MRILEQLVGEDPRTTFLPKHFTKLPFSRTGGGKEFLNLLDWKTVEEVLGAKKSVLRIVKDGVMIKDYVDMSYAEALDFHNKGNTLLLRFAEKSSPRLQELCNDFKKSFHTEVDI